MVNITYDIMNYQFKANIWNRNTFLMYIDKDLYQIRRKIINHFSMVVNKIAS